MPPTARVAWGFVVVVLDLRIGSFDVVLDPVGWVLVLSGLLALEPSSGWVTLARLGGVVGLLASFLQVFAVPGFALEVVNGIAETAVVFGVCSVVRQVVTDTDVQRSAGRIRAAQLAVAALGWVVALAADDIQDSGAAAVVVLPLVIAGLATAVWFVVLMLGLARRPEGAALH